MIPRTSGYALKVAAVLIAAVISRPAFGLDPARSLTQYIHRIQQMQPGLPQAAIFSIWQSHDGYLWLGTQRGLARFDGVRFTPLDETGGVSLQDTWVRSLYEDKRGDLWIGTNDAGLIRLSGREMKRFSTPSPSIHCLVPGSHGELWVCTTNGVARIADEKVVALGAAQGLATANIRGICEATDGGVWAGGDSADLSVWDGTRFTRIVFPRCPNRQPCERCSARATARSG